MNLNSFSKEQLKKRKSIPEKRKKVTKTKERKQLAQTAFHT